MLAVWHEVVEQARSWSTAVIVGALGMLAVALFHRLVWRRHLKTAESNLGFIGPLATFVLLGIAVIATTLSLPISEAARGQLLGLLGLLVTAAVALSSTTFLGNAMAGIMLRAIRHFRPGDYLRVEEFTGRVSEMGILHTEIQTEDRDLITLPNLYLVTRPVRVLRASGTVVSATVSLGYDIEYHDVEKHLMAAATRAGLSDPFVQVEELGDYSISYRAAGFLTEVKHLMSTRSSIRKAMLDTLHEAGIEIVSPSFVNRRDIAQGVSFIPGRRSPSIPKPIPQPEARIFDKADEAEAKSKLLEQHELQKATVAELESKLRDASFAVEREELEHKLAEAKSRLEAMAELI